MSFEPLKPQFDRDGYVVVRQLMPQDEFAELKRELDRYVRDVVPGLPPTDAFYDVDRRSPRRSSSCIGWTRTVLGGIPHASCLARLAESLLGEPATAESPEWFNKPPLARHGTPPHQDNYYFNLKPCSVVTLWMALDRVDDENACMRYVPGSHHGPVRPHARSQVLGFSQGITDYGPDDAAARWPFICEPGDVAAHHGNLIHSAGENRSRTRHRRAFAIVFQGASCRRDEEAFARYQAAVKRQQAELAASES